MMKDIRFVECDVALKPRVLRAWQWLTDAYLHLEDGFCLVAMDGEEPVGIISVYQRRLPAPLDEACEGYIDLIDVLAPHRRRGIARRLVDLSADRCRKQGLHQLRAWSSDDKVEAIQMWKALGFGLCPATTFPRGQEVKGYLVTFQL